jgi:hypothetical protein
MQGLSRTIAASHFRRTIEAVELEFDAMRWTGIEGPHPHHKFSIRVEPAKAMAKPGTPIQAMLDK